MFGLVQVLYKQDSEAGSATPEDRMLEQRVAVLEGDVSKIKTILERLEPKITEILLTGAKRSDLESARADARLESEKLRGDVREVAARVGALPSTWTTLGLVFTTWALGSGLLIFTLTRLLAK